MWRGFPKVVTTAIALPNVRKPDGYDYYAFSKGELSKILLASQIGDLISEIESQPTKCLIVTDGEKLNCNIYSHFSKEEQVQIFVLLSH